MSDPRPDVPLSAVTRRRASDDTEAQELARAAAHLQITRREFLSHAATAAAGCAAAAATGCADSAWQEFVQQHYLELTDEDKERIFRRLEDEVRASHGVDVTISDPQPVRDVKYGYALNMSYCIGCRRCEYACVRENNTSRDPEIHYIRVLALEKGSLDLERAETEYTGPVPQENRFYMPVQCHQCDNPPCVRACPVQATWKEPDGIVVIDYNWCIGCRYCEAACPYWARRFNWSEPTIPPSEINPDQAYLSNRLRPRGVVEKCTFCLQRTRRGLYPACVEVCPTGSRKFGNLLDPESEVSQIIATKRVYVLKEEVGTLPSFYYFFD